MKELELTDKDLNHKITTRIRNTIDGLDKNHLIWLYLNKYNRTTNNLFLYHYPDNEPDLFNTLEAKLLYSDNSILLYSENIEPNKTSSAIKVGVLFD